MSEVKNGNVVSVHYRGTLLETGEEFDSSHSRGETLTFEVGAGQMIRGFDTGVVGMKVGETKSIRINPEEGYGFRNEEAVQQVDKSQFPDGFDYTVGAVVQGTNPDGQNITATILKEEASTVTLDFNHPLASKILDFEVELLSIAEG